MKIRITFTEPVLGTISGNKELAEEYIAAKNPAGIKQEEIEAIPEFQEQLEKTSTIFPRDNDGEPMLWDYQVKGFLKAACKAMIDTDEFTKEELKKVNLTNYTHKRTIDQQVFVMPRRIKLIFPEGPSKTLPFCERSIRVITPKGERNALARSEEAPAGTHIECEIISLNSKLIKKGFLEWWLNYGKYSGIGQWRNSGKGRFSYEILGG